MRSVAKLLFIVALASALAGCNSSNPAASGTVATGPKPLVFFSQANSADPWRQVFDAETKAAAETHQGEFNFEEQQADDSAEKQIGQIETAMVKKPKVLLVSPATVALQQAIEEAHGKGAFVVLLDRSIPGDKWDCYVGGDNHAIGFAAGQYMGKKLNGNGIVLMIQGIADAPPTKDRAAGFMEAMAQFPNIKVIPGNNCDYNRQKAESYMENFLQSGKAFDAVYAHNDEMAIGAYMAMDQAHTPKKVIVGIDGCQMEIVNMIKEGKVDATFSYPDPGPKGIEVAWNFINGQRPKAKKILLSTAQITKETADAYVAQHPNLAK
ncbi:MAG: substrate-binding domain-containing protein [Fimbriimonadales bacterium]